MRVVLYDVSVGERCRDARREMEARMNYLEDSLTEPYYDGRDGLCRECRGLSPTVEQIDHQLADSGDTSGACSRCNNTHVDPDHAPSRR